MFLKNIKYRKLFYKIEFNSKKMEEETLFENITFLEKEDLQKVDERNSKRENKEKKYEKEWYFKYLNKGIPQKLEIIFRKIMFWSTKRIKLWKIIKTKKHFYI
jgi:hypothetical protein